MPDLNPIKPPLREVPAQTRADQVTNRPDSSGTVQTKTNFDAQPMKVAVAESMKEHKEFNPAQQTNMHNAPETTKQQVLSPPQVDVKQAEMKEGFNPASTILRGQEKQGNPQGGGDGGGTVKEQDAIGEDVTSAALQAKNELENSSTIPRPLMDKVKQEIAETIGALAGLPQARGRLLLVGPDNNEMTQLGALLELAGYVAPVLTGIGVESHYMVTHPPDMLLLDLATSGYGELLAAMQASPATRSIPVLALSSGGYPMAAEDAPLHGFSGVVSKELPPTDFPKVVTEFFVQYCPEKVGGEGAAGGAAVQAAPLTYNESVSLEQTLDQILGTGGRQGKQLRGFLLQVADMTREAAEIGEQLKKLEALAGGSPAALGNAASLQEIHRFLVDSGEKVKPLEKTSYVQMGVEAVQQRVTDTKARAARHAMQLSARLLQLPQLVGDYIRNFGSVHTAGPAPGQQNAEAFQKVLDGVIGQAREQAHSLGGILGRMENVEQAVARAPALADAELIPAAGSAFDILPGLAEVLGGVADHKSA